MLYRNWLVSDAATASVFPAWPGAAVGGTQADEDFTPWLTSATMLTGNNAHAYADVDASNTASASEEIPPSSGTDYRYPLTPVASSGTCPAVAAPGTRRHQARGRRTSARTPPRSSRS